MSGFLSRGLVVVAVFIACAVGLTAAFALLVAAEYFAFAMILSAPLAALAAAGTALFFCFTAVIVGRLILSSMKKRARRELPKRIAAILGEVFGTDLGEFADRHPARSLAAALAAGFVLGFSPKLRKFLTLFLRR
jgi:hypothetical protein